MSVARDIFGAILGTHCKNAGKNCVTRDHLITLSRKDEAQTLVGFSRGKSELFHSRISRLNNSALNVENA